MPRETRAKGEADDARAAEKHDGSEGAVEVPTKCAADFVFDILSNVAEENALLRLAMADVGDEETRLLLAAEKRRQESGLACSVTLSSSQSGPALPGDLYGQCVEQWVKLATGDNKHEAAGLRHRIAEMVREMEAEGAGTKSERLLIEQVAIQWVQVHFYERLQASTPEVSAEVAEYKSRKAELALRKYIKAIESLAKIRTIPIRARTLVMQQTVLPSEAPRPCIDVASTPSGSNLLPSPPLGSGEGLMPAIACIDASSVQQSEMVARDRGRKNRSTRAARSIDVGSKSL